MPYAFGKECGKAFNLLKQALILAPIVKTPYWTKPFEFMFNASDFSIGVLLSLRHNKVFHTIYYASRTLIEAKTQLYHYWEGTTGSCVYIWQVQIILGGHQGDNVYWPCSYQLPHCK